MQCQRCYHLNQNTCAKHFFSYGTNQDQADDLSAVGLTLGPCCLSVPPHINQLTSAKQTQVSHYHTRGIKKF